MPQVFMVNPAKRKRRAGARRKSSRKASPAQRAARARFAAMARARSSAPKRRRSIKRNPAPALAGHRRRVRRISGVRRVRRNPSGGGSLSLNGILRQAKADVVDAAIGAAGAVGVDMLMGQAIKYLPDSAISRYTAEGKINFMYYLAKAGIAVGAGVVGAKFTSGSTRRYVAQGVKGSFTVMAYELARASLPADMIALGYYQPQAISAAGQQPTGRSRAMGFYPQGVNNVSMMPRRPALSRPTSMAQPVSMAGSAGGQIGSQNM